MLPISVKRRVTVAVLKVGMFLIAGSLLVLTSIFGIVVTPSSLKSEYPVIGQPPS